MKTRKLNQQTKLAITCDQLYKDTNQFLESSQEKQCIPCLFYRKSKEEKIASSLLDVINNYTVRMSFPQLGFFEENQLLDNLNHCYKTLSIVFLQNVNNKQKMDSKFYVFFSTLQSCLNDIVRLFCPDIQKVDLRYLDEYIERRECGVLERDDLLNVSLLGSNNSVNQVPSSSLKKRRLDYTQFRSHSLFNKTRSYRAKVANSVNDSAFVIKI